MQYMLLIYIDEQAYAAQSDAERAAVTAAYMELVSELRTQGTYLAGAPLQSSDTATTVRLRDGDTLVVDGPYAETKEQLGGYFLVEAETLDDAIAVAERIPASGWGTIEVRPVIPVGVPA